jgi:Tol biopolymer transport system component
VVVLDRAGSVVASSPEYWGVLGVAWSADGNEVFYSALATDEGGDYVVRSLDLDGTSRMVLAAPVGVIVHDRMPDGRFLVSSFVDSNLVFARLAGAEFERELPWLGSSFQPILSQDGRSLIFGDSSSLSGRLYSVLFRAADGSPPARLGDGDATDISPDGASVVALVTDEPPRLVIYPTGAGEPRDISAPGFVSYEPHAQFLADGRRVAYCGNAAGEASRCYVRDLAGDAARAVTPEGIWSGRISPDGTAVVARGPDGRYRIYRGDADSGELVPGVGEGDEVLRFRPDGRSLLVFRPAELPVPVDRLDLATGERTTVWRLAPADRAGLVSVGDISLSADEGAYAYAIRRNTGALFTVEGVQ